jgi:Phage tail assembly chaperone, TAC
MDLNALRELGGLVPLTPVVKELTWTPPPAEDGTVRDEVTLTVRIKKLSAGSMERLGTFNDKTSRSYVAALLSQSILLGDEGSDFLSYEDAFQLEPNLGMALTTLVHDVNGRGDAAKNSPPPTNSGATS